MALSKALAPFVMKLHVNNLFTLVALTLPRDLVLGVLPS